MIAVKEKLWSGEFLGLGIASCLLYITQYVLIATLPIVITKLYGGFDFDAGMAMTYFQIGTISCRIFAGSIVDAFNKRRVLWTSTIFFFLVMAAFNFTESINLIFLLRFLHGLIFAISTTATATGAVMVLPKSRKGEGVGYFAVFSNLAMVIGPFMGLVVLNDCGATVLFLMLTAIGISVCGFANGKPLADSIALPKHDVSQKRFSVHNIVEKRSIPWAFLTLFVSFTYSGVLVFVPIMMMEFGVGGDASWFFVLFALAIVVTRPVIGRIYDRLGSPYLLYPGFIIFLLGMLLLCSSHAEGGILWSGPILGLGYGALGPALQTLSVQAAPPDRTGAATATFFLAMDIGVGLGSAILSLLVEDIGFNWMFFVNAMVVLAGLIVYHFGIKRFAGRLAD